MIDDRTLRVLEFDKIVRQVREHASFSAGQQAIENLRPSVRRHEVAALLDQTEEARALLEARPGVHLGGAHDVRGSVRRAEIGSVLSAQELLDIGSTLGAASRVRAAVVGLDLDLPWLAVQVQRMVDQRELRQSLDSTFSERGDVLDSASPALRRIRTDIQTTQARIIERLNSMASSPNYRSALQEALVTMRNGRYVLPVRQDGRGKIQGVVHDQSASGQTVFIEPIAVTEMNNRLTELQLDEHREIERILQELSTRVAAVGPELRETVDALQEVDVAFAKARYAGAIRASRPRVSDRPYVSLVSARHPLLQGDVVPVSVALGGAFRLLIITGPNTGGKTVALKTVGLLTLMAQSGLHIPAAEESEIGVFPRIFADIGDEQSIEQSLSTFSSHMRNIIAMLPQIDAQSLVLLDELGAGTDPQEGAGLARALLLQLLDSGALGVVTTHFSEIKTFAHEQEGVENASVEFDVRTLSPTYRLVVGLPGRSQALAIAQRLGMPESVLNRARESLSTGAVRVEKMLSQIQMERQEIGRLYARTRELHIDARKLRDRLQAELETMQGERDSVLSAAREEAAQVVREARRQIRELEERARSRGAVGATEDLQTRIDVVQQEAASRLHAPAQAPSEEVAATLEEGATVRIISLGQQGTVLSTNGREAEVQFGQFKVRVPVEDVQVLSRRERAPERTVSYAVTTEAPPMEIDVRGWRADDAVREIDQYIHDNYMHGQNTVRVVHGKGTGALRRAIRDVLNDNPLVKSQESERPELGGDGVTVVKLAT